MRLFNSSPRATARRCAAAVSCAAVLTVGAIGWAQPVPPAPPAPAVSKPPPKDPTQPDPDLRSKLDPPRGVQPDPGRPQDAPVITLKGRLITATSATALLDVDGRLHAVRKGAVIGLGGRGAVRVVEVSAAGVQIEFVASKEVLMLP